MLTPKFSLTQDDQFVYLKMHVPHLKFNETETHVEDDEVYFHSKPYFLRLHLPGNVVEDDRSKCSYDVDSGWLSITLSKQKTGEHFDNLDMLTKLLTPKSTSQVSYSCANVEVLESSSFDTDKVLTESKQDDTEKVSTTDVKDDHIDEDDVELDWFIEQTPFIESNSAETLLSKDLYSYGFAHQKSSPLDPLLSELTDLIDLKNPDFVPKSERSILRYEQEEEKFDCEHYLADFFDDEQIPTVISADYKELTGVNSSSTVFSDEEEDQLLKLPRKEYIIDDSEISSVYLGVVDLLLAYAFDYRQFSGEQSVESDWNICKLSSMLSWLDSFTDLKEVVVSFCRRSLCFPLYRNWKVFEKVVSDVQMILQAGKTHILKCLLKIYSIVRRSEAYYPLADIFLTDYCVWIQSACPKRLQSMAKALSTLTISKDDVGFRLNEMEIDATNLIEQSDEETEIDRLAATISKAVTITSKDDDSDDDDSSLESDECDSDDSSSEEDSSGTSSIESSECSDKDDTVDNSKSRKQSEKS